MDEVIPKSDLSIDYGFNQHRQKQERKNGFLGQPLEQSFDIEPVRIAILFSGRGSNMRALAQSIADDILGAELALTLCNRPDAAGIDYAKTLDVPCAVIDHTHYKTRTAFEDEMQSHLEKEKIDLICAAGFMRLLTPAFVEHWQDRLLNIHPSLLPHHKGLNTHEAVLAAGDAQHGCTVHYMRPAMDDGPHLVQKSLWVKGDDTADSLAARVLELEHIAYREALPQAIDHIRFGKEQMGYAPIDNGDNGDSGDSPAYIGLAERQPKK